MTKYLFAYHGGGMPDTEEESAKVMAAWGEWMGSHEAGFIDMVCRHRGIGPAQVHARPRIIFVRTLP